MKSTHGSTRERLAALAAALLLLFSHGLARATPSRVYAIDNGNSLVVDDWDVKDYYNLIPNFTNHLYFYSPYDGDLYGWANVNVWGPVAVTIWINRPAAAAPLFQGLVSQGLNAAYAEGQGAEYENGLGYSNAGLDDAWTNSQGLATDPKELRVGVPDTKLSLGAAYNASAFLSLGACLQYAEFDKSEKHSPADAWGNLVSGGSLSNASLVQAYYGGLSVTSYSNTQQSSSLMFGPALGLHGDSYVFDMSGTVSFNTINNTHHEDLLPAGAVSSGQVEQTLKDEGKLSWQAKARLQVPVFENGILVLNGHFVNNDLSTLHQIQDQFNGTGLPAAGIDQTDRELLFTQRPWASMLGLVASNSTGLLVVGLGANGSTLNVVERSFGPKGGSLSQFCKLTETAFSGSSFNLPAVIGGELAVFPWMKLRSVAQRNILGSASSDQVVTSYSPSNGAQSGRVEDQTGDDQVAGWVLRFGLGLEWGPLGWDNEIDLAADDATFSEPAVSSSMVVKW